jgi:hypothetical protein
MFLILVDAAIVSSEKIAGALAVGSKASPRFPGAPAIFPVKMNKTLTMDYHEL